MEQQAEASTLGMWVFLVTEIMFFGGLFMAYLVYRYLSPRASQQASPELNVVWGTINTAVLICSSLTMALAVRAAQTSATASAGRCSCSSRCSSAPCSSGSRSSSTRTSSSTTSCPGPHFHWDGQIRSAAEHVLLALLRDDRPARAAHDHRPRHHDGHRDHGLAADASTPEYYTPVEVTGLYWHFVDIVWIFLFPLLYLIGGHFKG